MNSLFRLFAFVAITGFAPTPSLAADLENGQILARKCCARHAKNAMARSPDVPNLAGQSSIYLEKILKDFRDGMREDRRMSIIVKTLSDDDIKDLAAWFSTYVVTVERPE